ncbi:MAG: PHP domain-containing protein, partial [Bacteroides sp.]|nr:PHP domain-containing protein [Bacteroides sp.]
MKDFVHLHVHTQYSLLDGQASIPKLVEKAIGNGMRGIAVTDHGSMYGIKEFMNYVGKKNSKTNDAIKKLKKEIARIETEGTEEEKNNLDKLKAELKDTQSKIFKPIIGCEMYVARRGMRLKEGRLDQS